MDIIKNKVLVGERALFQIENAEIEDCTFEDGESPLKESKNNHIQNSTFSWKYPIWYSNNIKVENSVFNETARSGIWYTENISIINSKIDCPKIFRRSKNIYLENCNLNNASESLWNCDGFSAKDIYVRGDYFGMNSKNITVDNMTIDGNYVFDCGKNIVIKNSHLNSKDAFWNCENVVIINCEIDGEYFGWNSKNITIIDSTISSLQGFCYMENLAMKNCILKDTTLAFEYSTVEVEINSKIDSVKNPYGGTIRAKEIGEIILEDKKIDPKKTNIIITR